MEQISPPSGFKKILCYIGNVVLFLLYYYGISFCLGMVIGVVQITLNDPHVAESILDYVVSAAFVINVLLTILLRKKMYFHITKTA